MFFNKNILCLYCSFNLYLVREAYNWIVVGLFLLDQVCKFVIS